MSLILINSGELLITLRDDWLRLRTESLKFSGLAKIFEGIFPFPAAAVSAEVWRTEVLQIKQSQVFVITRQGSSPWQGSGADCLVVQGAGVHVGGGLGLVHPGEAHPGPQVVRRPGPGQRLLGVEVDILVIRLGLLPCLLYKTLVNIYSEERRKWSLISGMAGLGKWEHPVKLSEMVLKV